MASKSKDKINKTEIIFNHDIDIQNQLKSELNLDKVSIAGIDEAGRGPLAGPVVCAACIMPMDFMIEKIYDSKKVSLKTREELYQIIKEKAISYFIAEVDNETIDKINILNATKLGMKMAAEGLICGKNDTMPDIILVDAVKNLDIKAKQQPIIKGDATSYNIAAASILAKVYRDDIMQKYDKIYPEYGFASHKGYGTQKHIDALLQYGKTSIHRNTFIKNFVQ